MAPSENQLKRETAMNLKKVLEENNIALDSIYQIYNGKDHNCRCGCAGKYYEKKTNPVGFQRVLNRIQKNGFEPLVKGEDMWFSQARVWGKSNGLEVDVKHGYINIPYSSVQDKCYTLYFYTTYEEAEMSNN